MSIEYITQSYMYAFIDTFKQASTYVPGLKLDQHH